MYVPKINLPPEGVEHARWLEQRVIEQDKAIAELRRLIAAGDKANAASGRQVATINREQQSSSTTRGMPDGGNPGEVVRVDQTGKLRWFPNLSGNTPRLYIHLEDGDPSYQWDIYSSIDPVVSMPQVEFYDDGRSFRIVGWREADTLSGGYWGLLPINYDIQVAPHSDGERFECEIPSTGAVIGSGETSNFTLTVHNSFGTGFTADVRIGASDLLFGGADFVYSDSRAVPWYSALLAGNFENLLTLAPNEQAAWEVQQSPTLENLLTPTLSATVDDADRAVTYPLDFYYWRYVSSRRHAGRVHIPGTVAVGAVKESLYNDTADSCRVGLVRATVGTAPTGADLEVDVKVDGVAVGTVTIAAGATTGSAELTGYTHGPGGTHTTDVPLADSVLWFPGDALTFEVAQVGSTVAGSDLTVQVCYG